jgi:hypothetical protein
LHLPARTAGLEQVAGTVKVYPQSEVEVGLGSAAHHRCEVDDGSRVVAKQCAHLVRIGDVAATVAHTRIQECTRYHVKGSDGLDWLRWRRLERKPTLLQQVRDALLPQES